MASNISVVFQAFTEKFEKKTAQAGKSISSFGKKAIGIGVGFIAARAGVAQFSNSLRRLNELGKISKSLNVSPDFLRGLKLGTAEVGESFEKAQDLIKEFNIRMGEAKTGAGPALEGLKLLGLTMKDIGDASPEEAFLKVSDAIAKMDDEQKKIFAAGDIFGGAGEDALSVLNLGAEGLKKAIAEARELGGPISKDDLDSIENANGAVVRMGLAFEGIIDQTLIHFSPLLEDIAAGMVDLIQWVKIFGDEWKKVSGIVEGVITELFFDGKGSDIELGSRGFKSPKDKKIKKSVIDIAPQSIKTFAVAAQAGSSAAFDQLNPSSPSSIQGKQLSKLESIDQGIKEIVSKDTGGANFTQVSIGGS